MRSATYFAVPATIVAAVVVVFGVDPDHASTQLVLKAPRSGVIVQVSAASGEFSQAVAARGTLS